MPLNSGCSNLFIYCDIWQRGNQGISNKTANILPLDKSMVLLHLECILPHLKNTLQSWKNHRKEQPVIRGLIRLHHLGLFNLGKSNKEETRLSLIKDALIMWREWIEYESMWKVDSFSPSLNSPRMRCLRDLQWPEGGTSHSVLLVYGICFPQDVVIVLWKDRFNWGFDKVMEDKYISGLGCNLKKFRLA